MSHSTILIIPVVVLALALLLMPFLGTRRDRAFYREWESMEARLRSQEERRSLRISENEREQDEAMLRTWLA